MAEIEPLVTAVRDGAAQAGAGATSAAVAGLAADLLATAIDGSREGWAEAGGAAAQAAALRRRALGLAASGALRYAEARTALAAPDDSLGGALARALEAPEALAHVGADLAALAADVAPRIAEPLRPEMLAGASLGAAAAAVAVDLVAANLTVQAGDERLKRVRDAAGHARVAERRAREAIA